MRMYDRIGEVTSRVTGWGGPSTSSKEFEDVCTPKTPKYSHVETLTSIPVVNGAAETCNRL